MTEVREHLSDTRLGSFLSLRCGEIYPNTLISPMWMGWVMGWRKSQTRYTPITYFVSPKEKDDCSYDQPLPFSIRVTLPVSTSPP